MEDVRKLRMEDDLHGIGDIEDACDTRGHKDTDDDRDTEEIGDTELPRARGTKDKGLVDVKGTEETNDEERKDCIHRSLFFT